MAKIEWNDKAFIAECIGVGMDRLVQGAKAVRDDAKRILKSKLKGGWKEHGPYKRYRDKKTGRMITSAGKIWTERKIGEMVKTIRVVRKKDLSAREVRIYMGNYKTWWAIQMEYGQGEWRGKARPCLRSALNNANNTFRFVFESGAGETKLEPGWEVVK